MATTDQLIARLGNHLAEVDVDLYPLQDRLDALNDARQVCFSGLEAILKQATIALVASTSVYDAPADLGRWLTLRFGTTRMLTPISPTEAEGLELGGSTADIAYFADYLDGTDRVIELHPPVSATASGTLYGRYSAIPAALDTDDLGAGHTNAPPLWHEPFHYIVCLYAAYTLLDRDRRLESANVMLGRYELELERYKRYLATNKPKRPTIVKSKWGTGRMRAGRVCRDEPFITP
jgi:hypothetical protein